MLEIARYLGACVARSGKPVKFRRGRATVIGPRVFARRAESQTPLVIGHISNGTRKSQEFSVTSTTFPPIARPIAIPIREALPWVVFAGLILMLAVYFVGAEEGATSLVKGMYVHEFVHDGRHLLGFPCH
jgi:hypothetical protein